jgi:hypothetical protein
MADPEERPGVREDVLEAVTEAMVALHERYHARKPASARTMMMGDDMVACLLGDVYTDVEKTMIELQRKALVHETRSAFQQAMEHRFIAAVQGSPDGACRGSSPPTTSAPTSSSSSSSHDPCPYTRREQPQVTSASSSHDFPGPRRGGRLAELEGLQRGRVRRTSPAA